MRAVERQVEEEGLIGSDIEKIDRRSSEHIAAISGIALRLTALEQDRIEVVASSRQVRGLTDSTPLENERFLKAPVDGPQGEVVAQVPLAEDPGAIARRGQAAGPESTRRDA